MTLIHDIPSSEGVKNGLKRAKRMVEANFTPIKPYPIVIYSAMADGKRVYHEHYAPAWRPEKGLPYSSVRRVEKYIGYNVSFETFYTALTNPDSVVYTRPITGTGQNVHNHYGIVCSCFVSEVLEFPYRTPCIRIPDVPGVSEISAEPLENLRLLDIVLNVKRHVAIITDIERDENNVVRFITVSESVLPYCRVIRYTPEEFRGYWLENEYRIFRYDKVDDITYMPDPFVPIEEDGAVEPPKINRSLMTDYGNKANYRLGEPVEIRVFEPGARIVCVEGPDGKSGDGRTSTFLSVTDRKCTFCPECPGHYSAYAVPEGEKDDPGKDDFDKTTDSKERNCSEKKSDPVEFCVTDLAFTFDKDSYLPGEKMRIRFRSSAGDTLVAWQINRISNDRGCSGGFFAEPVQGDEIVLTAPDAGEPVEFYLLARNEYGVYSSDRVKIGV